MVRADRSPLRVVCGVWGQSLGNQLDRHCAETVGQAHDKFSIRLTIRLVVGGSWLMVVWACGKNAVLKYDARTGTLTTNHELPTT